MPVLRGAWKVQLYFTRIPAQADLLACSDAFEEDGNRQQQTCIAELFAPNGMELSDVTIDVRCARITLMNAGLDAGTIEGLPIMRFALNQRNLSITEVSRKSSRMAILQSNSEWPVNLQVINPVQVLAKAGVRSL